jgi:hypothetical protein
MNNNPLVIACLCICLLFVNLSLVYAETFSTKLTAIDDSILDEDDQTLNQGDSSLLTAGWSNSFYNKQRSVSEAISYIKFDIHDIPKSTLADTVTIDSADLKLLTSANLGEANKFLVTIHYCPNNSWSENSIVWSSRTCKNQSDLKGSDSVIVRSDDLPTLYSWDVTREFVKARDAGQSQITFVVTAFPLSEKYILADEFILPERGELVWFWSKERSSFGLSAAPALIVTHTSFPSVINNSIQFLLIAILPALAIMVPVIKKFFVKDESNAQTKEKSKAPIN